MKKSCPISGEQVDANLVRINAMLVAILAIAFIFFKLNLFAFLLVVDFFIRIFISQKYSYMLIVAKLIKKTFGISTIKTDAAPKKFASMFGLVFSILIVLLSLIGFVKLTTIVAVILIICALLEAIFNYCLGCQIYYIFQSVKR